MYDPLFFPAAVKFLSLQNLNDVKSKWLLFYLQAFNNQQEKPEGLSRFSD